MTREQQIRDLATVARDLNRLRNELLNNVPFGQELEATRYDLERVAAPVVAVMGGACAGKSTLINTLCGAAELLPTSPIPTTLIPVQVRGGKRRKYLVGTAQEASECDLTPEQFRSLITEPESAARYIVLEAPEAGLVPWAWLDTPGTNSESKKDRWPFPYPPTLADICIFVSPATQALSLADIQQLLWLADAFPKGHLLIAVSRTDLLSTEQLSVVKNFASRTIQEALAAKAPDIFYLSSVKQVGTDTLRDRLSDAICNIQEHRLKYELESFGKLLVDVKKIMDLKSFAGVRTEIVELAQEKVVANLQAGILDIIRLVPRFAEDALSVLSKQIPEKQRRLATSLHDHLIAKIQHSINELGTRLNDQFIEIIQRDLKDKSVAARLNDKFSELFRLGSPEFFDPKGAAMGAAVGVGLAAAIGLALPIVGTALLGAALASSAAGGVLGGLFGSGTTISTIEEFRERIVRPAITQTQVGLSNASHDAVRHVEQFCRTIMIATRMLDRPDSKNRDLSQMLDAVLKSQREIKPLRAKFDTIIAPPVPPPT